MRNLSKNLLIAIAVFVGIAVLFALLVSPIAETPKVSLKELVEKINAGEVQKILVKGDTLEVTLSSGAKVKARKEAEAAFSETLRNFGVVEDKLRAVDLEVKDDTGLTFVLNTLVPFLLPFILIGFFIWFMFRQAQRGNMQAFTFSRAQPRLASPLDKNRITFDDVAGLKEAKEELREIVEFLKSPKKFLDIGARIPRGVLLMGPPGSGKTLLARAVAGEANVPFFHISGSEFVELFVGVGAGRVRDLFRTAKRNAPAIIFVDEIDAVGRHRGAGLGGGHDEREQTLNQILVEMDGFDRETQVIVIAATNRPDILDPALLRPGRFDRRVVLDEPDIEDRQAILKIHGKGKPLAKNADLVQLAERTPGFSGADLANLVNEAAILAARRGKNSISQAELLESIEKVMLGPERRSHLLSKREKEIAAYHEAGHALTAAAQPDADPVHKISIVSRGLAAGYTLKLPVEDRHLHTRSQFLADLAVMLGGYSAEEIVFKEITTGAGDDLRRASQLARKLVTSFGMSEKVGPVVYGEKEELVFLGKELGVERNYSEKVAALIDKEVERLIRDAHEKARSILSEKRALLEEIARRLIAKETIEREEFDALVAGKVPPKREAGLAPIPDLGPAAALD
ncbi:ATP-dependent zinc metalloprotease FtsH [Candidatus Parcubacteria bacterium]|nr:ATP-dependent zinc metalloprotease FtsH [Candidatus Parcubacteria bacterium]